MSFYKVPCVDGSRNLGSLLWKIEKSDPAIAEKLHTAEINGRQKYVLSEVNCHKIPLIRGDRVTFFPVEDVVIASPGFFNDK